MIRSVAAATSGTSSISPRTMSAPAIPPRICWATPPWRCGWYQNRPPVWSAGSRSRSGGGRPARSSRTGCRRHRPVTRGGHGCAGWWSSTGEGGPCPSPRGRGAAGRSPGRRAGSGPVAATRGAGDGAVVGERGDRLGGTDVDRRRRRRERDVEHLAVGLVGTGSWGGSSGAVAPERRRRRRAAGVVVAGAAGQRRQHAERRHAPRERLASSERCRSLGPHALIMQQQGPLSGGPEPIARRADGTTSRR